MEANSWAWAAKARALALRLGVSADEIAVDVHRGDDRLASDVTAQQMWLPVIRRLHEIEDGVRRPSAGAKSG